MGVFGIDPEKRVDVPNGLRRTGVTGGKGIFDEYMNQILFELKTNHIWGTSAQVKLDPPASTFYTDGSGNPLDKDDAAVTINEDDKILIAHDVTQTANLLLDCGGKKITLEMLAGVTLNMDTYDLTLGGTGDSIGGNIRVIGTGVGTLTIEESSGFRVVHATMIIDNLGGDITINNTPDQAVEFETSKDLIGNFISVSQARATFSRMSLINKTDFTTKYLNNKTITWTMPGDLESGQTEQASTDYGCWLDSDENLRLVADIESVTDGVTAGFLDDSANTAATQLWKAGDIIYNLDDKTKTTIKTTPTIDGNDVELNDDIFLASPKNYKVVKQSPEGLGENRERLFTVENNSGSDFDDSWYAQIQDEKTYSEAAGDFNITPTGAAISSIEFTEIEVKQVANWTGGGFWRCHINGKVILSVADSVFSLAYSGIVFESGGNQAALTTNENATITAVAWAPSGGDSIEYRGSGLTQIWPINSPFILGKKPPFHN